MVRIKVGTGAEAQVFDMYKGVLSFYSGYFRTAIKNIEQGHFIESESGTIELAEESPCIFKYFKDWVYTRTLPLYLWKKISLVPAHDIVSLWIFADRRDIPLLQNGAINWLAKKIMTDAQVPTGLAPMIWEQTPTESMLRRFMVTVYSTCTEISAFEPESVSSWTAESLCEVVVAMMKSTEIKDRSPATLAKLDMCQFHVHEEGVRCAKHWNEIWGTSGQWTSALSAKVGLRG